MLGQFKLPLHRVFHRRRPHAIAGNRKDRNAGETLVLFSLLVFDCGVTMKNTVVNF